MDFKNISTSILGVKFSENCTLEEWERFGVSMGRMLNYSQFVIGDWLNFGRDKWCDKAKYSARIALAVRNTKLDPKTLNNLASVARRIPLENRNPHCSYCNHIAVAKLPHSEQSKWLDIAAKENMTKRRLSSSISAGRIISVDELIKKKEPAYESFMTHSYAIQRLWNALDASKLSVLELKSIKTQLKPAYEVCRAVSEILLTMRGGV